MVGWQKRASGYVIVRFRIPVVWYDYHSTLIFDGFDGFDGFYGMAGRRLVRAGENGRELIMIGKVHIHRATTHEPSKKGKILG